MPKLNIDGKDIDVEDGITLIQACEEAGVEIPRFCYHERLSIAGNCRMCLVEVVGMPKLAASCALGVNDMRPGPNGEPPQVRTNSPAVKKAREGTMEFLLINHPLDCPICDQGGECDLQDQAMAFGLDTSRFEENKRAVEDRNIGPLIKTSMTRCISCTRCVRFMTEVGGVEELGSIWRGEDAEITTYLDAGMLSELSGNVIDLCPVGALTSRPFAFTARPWELTKTESIDVMDAMGSNIRIDARGGEVMRILPRNNDEINEEWITDKARFIWDGLRTQRLDRPYLKKNGTLKPVSWDEAFFTVRDRICDIQGVEIAAIAGDLAAAEEMYALKQLMAQLGSPNIDCRAIGNRLKPQLGRASYLFNSTIEGVDHADALLLIGTNPRQEAAILNARIRAAWRNRGLKIGLIGEQADLHYDYEFLGAGPQTLVDVLEDKHPFADILKKSARPMIVVGQAAVTRDDGSDILALSVRLAMDIGAFGGDSEWNGFNVLQVAAGRIAGLDLGFTPGADGMDGGAILEGAANGQIKLLYLLGADEFELSEAASAFIIYQGSHGDRGAHHADVIFPGAAYSEKDATYVNIEGRAQNTVRAAFPPGEAKEDWAIIRALSGHLGSHLPFDTLAQLRTQMYRDVPCLGAIGEISTADTAALGSFASKGINVSSEPFGQAIEDFYLCNPVTRSSAIMAEMSALRSEKAKGATGTHG